jgi:hypothetical protein
VDDDTSQRKCPAQPGREEPMRLTCVNGPLVCVFDFKPQRKCPVLCACTPAHSPPTVLAARGARRTGPIPTRHGGELAANIAEHILRHLWGPHTHTHTEIGCHNQATSERGVLRRTKDSTVAEQTDCFW